MLAAGLGPLDIDAQQALYGGVTADAALSAYTDVVDPDALTLTVVGAADELAEPLRAAGFPVDVVAADEPFH
jgi:hypothetical protein